MTTYKIQLLAAAMLFLFPLSGKGEDISTVSIEKNGEVIEETALPAPVSPETLIPKKVQKESSLQEENEGIRQALLDYFGDTSYDKSLMSYAAMMEDLNGDGKDEALVLLESPYTDREGKPALLIFTPSDNGWQMTQELTGVSTPLMVFKRDKNDKDTGFRPLYMFSTDETGAVSLLRLTPREDLYPLAVNGEPVELKDKTLKKKKGKAFFCSEDRKKEPVRWFTLGNQEKTD